MHQFSVGYINSVGTNILIIQKLMQPDLSLVELLVP